MKPLSLLLPFALAVTAVFPGCKCKGSRKPHTRPPSGSDPPPLVSIYASLDRATVNRLAFRRSLPLFWVADRNSNRTLDPDELATPLFLPEQQPWTSGGTFTESFRNAYSALVREHRDPVESLNLPKPELDRHMLVIKDLEQGTPTLVLSSLKDLPEQDKAFVRALTSVAPAVDALYLRQLGADKLLAALPPDDLASAGLFRRNWGPRCVGSLTRDDAKCSALSEPQVPKPDAYPAALQSGADFCDSLRRHKDSAHLLARDVVVRDQDGSLAAESYSTSYRNELAPVIAGLRAAASACTAQNLAAQRNYLNAAAASMESNDWTAAEAAWKLAAGSGWYVRVGSDALGWEPCNRKGGFHLTLARVNADHQTWNSKLAPLQQDMENAVAEVIGKPYTASKAAFALPIIADIIFASGAARAPLDTPNAQRFGAVPVVFSNLYKDVDSTAVRQALATSVLTTAALDGEDKDLNPRAVLAILREVGANLGPPEDIKVLGKTDEQYFGAAAAAMLRDVQKQATALWLIDRLKGKGVLSEGQAKSLHVQALLETMSLAVRTRADDPRGQAARVVLSVLTEAGAWKFEATATAANATDKGAFELVASNATTAAASLLQKAARARLQGSGQAVEELSKRAQAPSPERQAMADRVARIPQAALLFAVEL